VQKRLQKDLGLQPRNQSYWKNKIMRAAAAEALRKKKALFGFHFSMILFSANGQFDVNNVLQRGI